MVTQYNSPINNKLFVLLLPNMILLPRNTALPSFTTKRCRNHFYPGGGTLAITMRLAGSITRPAIRKIQALEEKYGNNIPADVYWSVGAAERDAFRQYAQGKTDRRSLNGPFYLHHNEEIRQFIFESILEEERRGGWKVAAFSLMPNHLHLVVKHMHTTRHMGKVIRLWKSYTGLQCNRILGIKGQAFWQAENYDTVVKTGADLRRHVIYTLRNPIAGGLAKKWQDWAGNYCGVKGLVIS